MSHPAAYIRRSFVDAESPGDISLESQRAAVRKLAHADGHNGDVVEYNDWGVSADIAKAGKRTEYARLLAEMEAGQVSAVYAFDVDRLYRDPRDLIRLQDAAQRHGVKVITTAGPLPIGEGADPASEGFAFITAVFGRMELQKTKKRAAAAKAQRAARGDDFGHPPYGWRSERQPDGRIVHVRDESVDLEPIRAAYAEAGTILGAVKLLNDRAVPTSTGRGRWYTWQLTRTIEKNWPEMLPRRNARGRRVAGSMALSQILRCHCGATLTPNFHRHQYYCSRGHVTAGHGQYTVTEMNVLPWLRERVDRLQVPQGRVEMAETNGARREAIEARVDRARELFMAGDIDRARFDAEKARAEHDLAAINDTEAAIDIPRIDWDWPAEDINRLLRLLIDHVELGPDLRPVGIVWRGSIGEWAA